MNGKVLRVFNNDLYGKVDERQVIVFAAFVHKKYMNKYAIFVFQNEYNQNKLCYGSIHIKENSLVTFKVKQETKSVFDDFLTQYTNRQLVDYELINISNLTKLEIIGYNEMPYNQILLLDDLSIPKPQVQITNPKQTNSTFKIIIPIIILIIGAISAYVFLTPSLLEFKMLTCSRNSYNDNIRLNYLEKHELIYDGRSNLVQYKIDEIYYFRTTLTYQNFKDESLHSHYFEGNNKTFKYNDDGLELIVTYNGTSDIDDLSKMKHKLEQANFTCREERYEK